MGEQTGEGTTAGTKELAADWAYLPRDCLIIILSRLSVQDRWRGAMLVCKPWLAASADSSLHTAFDLAARFDSAREFPRFWSPEFENRIDSMLRSAISWSDGSLCEIRTRHCSDRSIDFAAERCPNLRTLSIQTCPNVTDASMARLALNCRMLRDLDVSYCHDISHETLALVGRNCPNLITLKRNYYDRMHFRLESIAPKEYLMAYPLEADAEAAAIGSFMPRLRHLELRFSRVTGKGIASICGGCLDLEFLDCSGCDHIPWRDFESWTSRLKNLKQAKKRRSYSSASSAFPPPPRRVRGLREVRAMRFGLAREFLE